MEDQASTSRGVVAFLAPVTSGSKSALFGRQTFAYCGRILQTTQARPRSLRKPARIFALGAVPPPPPESDPEGEAGDSDPPKSEAPTEKAATPDKTPAEEVTADDILNSPSFLKKKLEIVQKELIEARDAAAKAEDAVKDEKSNYVRLAADFENYRRRSADDMRKLETKSTAKVCKAILEVLDNFDRANAAVKAETDRETTIQKSYTAINKQLVDALTRLKVEPIECVGSSFDPELHEAIQQVESTEYAEGVVCAQYSKGYAIGDSLIRAAVVAVSTGPGPEIVESDEAGESVVDASASNSVVEENGVGEVVAKESKAASEEAK